MTHYQIVTTDTIEMDATAMGNSSTWLSDEVSISYLPRTIGGSPTVARYDQFKDSGIFYFVPSIPNGAGRKSMVGRVEFGVTYDAFALDARKRVVSNPRTLSVIIEIEDGYTTVAPGIDPATQQGAVTYGSTVLEVVRLQQRLRYLGYPDNTSKPVVVKGKVVENGVVNAKVPAATQWAIGLFNAAVTKDGLYNVQDEALVYKRALDVEGKKFINAGNAPHWEEFQLVGDRNATGYIVASQRPGSSAPNTERWGTSWALELLISAGQTWKATRPASAATKVLQMNGCALKRGGPSRFHNATHRSGNDLDFETPSADGVHESGDLAGYPTVPFFKTVDIDGKPRVAAAGGKVIARKTSGAGYELAAIDATDIGTRAVTSKEAWKSPDLLWEIKGSLVNSWGYDAAIVKGKIDALLAATSPSGAIVDRVFYNDPRTWDPEGRVMYVGGHGGHFHAAVIPPEATPEPRTLRTAPRGLSPATPPDPLPDRSDAVATRILREAFMNVPAKLSPGGDEAAFPAGERSSIAWFPVHGARVFETKVPSFVLKKPEEGYKPAGTTSVETTAPLRARVDLQLFPLEAKDLFHEPPEWWTDPPSTFLGQGERSGLFGQPMPPTGFTTSTGTDTFMAFEQGEPAQKQTSHTLSRTLSRHVYEEMDAIVVETRQSGTTPSLPKGHYQDLRFSSVKGTLQTAAPATGIQGLQAHIRSARHPRPFYVRVYVNTRQPGEQKYQITRADFDALVEAVARATRAESVRQIGSSP